MPIKEDKLINPVSIEEDVVVDNALRPRRLKEYIGQQSAVKQLDIAIKAAVQRREPIDHLLLLGPPGLGKTTLARIVATELNTNISISSGPVLDKGRDIAALLSNLETSDVLFIDEIHRISATAEEILYPAMEEYKIDILLGEGVAARPLRLDVSPFTLVGATTRSGLLTSPLHDRFGIILRLDFYEVDDLVKIVTRSASLLKIEIDSQGAREIARRARGTPRIANRILRRVRDYAQVHSTGAISVENAAAALDILGIDENGLNEMDRRLLRVLVERFDGGPVGLANLATALDESKETLEDVIEPYLIRTGLIKRTQRGRVATDSTYGMLAIDPKRQNLL